MSLSDWQGETIFDAALDLDALGTRAAFRHTGTRLETGMIVLVLKCARQRRLAVVDDVLTWCVTLACLAILGVLGG